MQTTVHNSFQSLGLSDAILRDLAKAGFTEPTPIQAGAIPPALQGRDVIGCAQTGTGKTAAFVIPMIERLAAAPKGHPLALILAPTRELAIQTQEAIDKFGRSRRVFATTIVGGADMNAQVRGLRQHPEIIVATPGRLLDHMWNGTINLVSIKILVLDEADRMLDMGFAPQINQIKDLARASVKDPVRVMADKPATAAGGVAQALHHTTHDDKTKLLIHLLAQDQESVLVFTRTKHRADRLMRALGSGGHKVAVIHGDRSLSQRRAALEGFKRGAYRVLVATDIAARGIDVANIGHVVNFDMPNSPEDYVHRIGRTARMKAVGRATSFVTVDDHGGLRAIEKLLGQRVPLAMGSPEAATVHRPSSAAHNTRQGDGRPGRPSGFRPRRPAHARPSSNA